MCFAAVHESLSWTGITLVGVGLGLGPFATGYQRGPRARRISVAPQLQRGGVGVVVSGRF